MKEAIVIIEINRAILLSLCNKFGKSRKKKEKFWFTRYIIIAIIIIIMKCDVKRGNGNEG